MDLTLGFTAPIRHNSKMQLPFSVYKSKGYDNSMPLHIPMESDSSNMFDKSGSCRIPRWVLPQCGSSCNYVQKSAHFNKSGTPLQKIVNTREPTLAISISQQTIVGGFVGSKSHAGRSMFGDSSQIWDAVVCRFVELMSLVKERPNSVIPKSKLPHMDSSAPGIDDCKSSQPESSKESIFGPESATCSSSKKCVPHNYRVSNSTDAMKRVPNNSTHCAPTECRPVFPENKEPTLNRSKDIVPTRRGTYSSVVEGTFKSESARSGACTMVNIKQNDQPREGSQTSVPHAPLQSYADVTKKIPNKPMARPSKSGCEVAQNLKNMWYCRIKKNKINQDKKVVNHQGNENKDLTLDDFVSNGDTRWKGDWKSKRAKFQKNHPIAVSTNIRNSTSSETEEISAVESSTKETDSGSECRWTLDERESVDLKEEGLRGRHPSECSLDSEDSFVIFEECPGTALATPSRIPIDHYSSLEEGESDDDTSSLSDSSDSEDDDVENGEHFWKIDSFSSKLRANEGCIWISKCCAQTVPEKFKGIKKKAVHFAEGSHLTVIRPMIAWGYAYREARRGPWEEHARDRARFQDRIKSLAPVLNAILDPRHRRKVVTSRLYDM